MDRQRSKGGGGMAEKPGVMIYFDTVLPAFERLDDAQLGALFRAVVCYAAHGEVIELDGMTGLVFDLLRPKIERDDEKYREKCVKSEYATYCREMKKLGSEPLPYDRWVSNDTERYATPNASPNSNEIIKTSPKAAGAAEGERGGDTLPDAWNSMRNRALNLVEGYANG